MKRPTRIKPDLKGQIGVTAQSTATIVAMFNTVSQYEEYADYLESRLNIERPEVVAMRDALKRIDELSKVRHSGIESGQIARDALISYDRAREKK